MSEPTEMQTVEPAQKTQPAQIQRAIWGTPQTEHIDMKRTLSVPLR